MSHCLIKATARKAGTGPRRRRNERDLITLLRHALADCRRFYPWPALEQSILRDIERLKREHT